MDIQAMSFLMITMNYVVFVNLKYFLLIYLQVVRGHTGGGGGTHSYHHVSSKVTGGDGGGGVDSYSLPLSAHSLGSSALGAGGSAGLGSAGVGRTGLGGAGLHAPSYHRIPVSHLYPIH